MKYPDSFKKLLANPISSETWQGMNLYVKDLDTGKVLVDRATHRAHDPASLTKMMPYYMALSEHLDPNEKITISRSDAKIERSHVHAGHKIKVSDMLNAMMTPSDNGAAAAMGRRLGGADIGADMTREAHALGMNHTRFANANGMPAGIHKDGNQTTAADIAILTERIYREFPDQADHNMGKTSVRYEGQKAYADQFINTPGQVGRLPHGYHAFGKTGFTNNAGHNFAGMIVGPRTDQAPHGQHLLVVVMGAPRWVDASVAQAFGMRHDKKLVTKGNHFRDVTIGMLATAHIGHGTLHYASHVDSGKGTPHAEVNDLPEATRKEAAHCGRALHGKHHCEAQERTDNVPLSRHRHRSDNGTHGGDGHHDGHGKHHGREAHHGRNQHHGRHDHHGRHHTPIHHEGHPHDHDAHHGLQGRGDHHHRRHHHARQG